MSELTAVERRDRAVKSLSIAEERLNVIGRMLPELESKLQDSLVRHEISGYRLRAIQKIESEIDSLQKEKASLEKTIEALKKALPEFEKQARLETAEKETVFAYEKAKNEFIELLKGIPSLEGIKSEIEKLESYGAALRQSQGEWFALLQAVNRVLIEEDLQKIGNVDVAILKNDKESIDYHDLLAFSDSLIDLNEQINDLQYRLFKVAIAQVPIKEIQPEPVVEYSKEGDYYRIQKGGFWYLYRKVQLNKEIFPPKYSWVIVGEGHIKPVFPEEEKTLFSPCGRFQITKKNTRWVLFQKNDEGHWQKIKEDRERENLDFPTGLVPIVQEEEKKAMVGQRVYGNEDKIRDPDRSTEL